MVDNFLNPQKEEDWSRIYDASPFEGIFSLVDKFVTKVYDTQESSDYYDSRWSNWLHQRSLSTIELYRTKLYHVLL